MSKSFVWLGVALVLAGVAFWYTVLAPETIEVKVVPVERGAVESTVTNTKAGTVKARRRAQLSPEIAGTVAEIAHREGDRVERGAAIIRLNDASQQAQLALARESLRAAQAAQQEICIARDRARRELERKRELADREIVSDDLLDALESSYRGARAACNRAAAEVARARAQIEATEVEIAKLELRAPFAGVIAELAVEVGEWITPSPPLVVAPAVVDVIDPSSLYISAPMDEVDSSSIRSGQRSRVTVDSQPGVEFVGRVVRVAPYVLDLEAQNRTVEIEVELEDAALVSRLLPGTSADVEVILEVRDDVLRLPTPALLEGDHVLVARNGRLEEAEVEIGIKNWDYAEVKQGLEAGQGVVISLDRLEVKAGARVRAEPTEYRP